MALDRMANGFEERRLIAQLCLGQRFRTLRGQIVHCVIAKRAVRERKEVCRRPPCRTHGSRPYGSIDATDLAIAI
jgi:hypothetical protein